MNIKCRAAWQSGKYISRINSIFFCFCFACCYYAMEHAFNDFSVEINIPTNQMITLIYPQNSCLSIENTQITDRLSRVQPDLHDLSPLQDVCPLNHINWMWKCRKRKQLVSSSNQKSNIKICNKHPRRSQMKCNSHKPLSSIYFHRSSESMRQIFYWHSISLNHLNW